MAHRRLASGPGGPWVRRGVMGGQTVDRAFQGQPEQVFEACRRAAANCGFSVLTASKDALTISFNTGRSFRTFGGQDLTASVFDEGGSCRVVVGGSLAKGGNLQAGAQLAAWGEKKALSNKFLDEVRSAAGWSSGAMVARYTRAMSAELALDEIQRSWNRAAC